MLLVRARFLVSSLPMVIFLSNRTGSTQTVFQGTLSGVTKVNIEAGGAATFAGRVNVGANGLDNRAVVGYNDSNTAGSITNNYTSTGPVWQAYNASVNTSTATSTIFANGSANLASYLYYWNSKFSYQHFCSREATLVKVLLLMLFNLTQL